MNSLVLAALSIVPVARGFGRDLDTQLVLPTADLDGSWALEGPRPGEPKVLQLAATYQLERTPLRAYVDGVEVAPAIRTRQGLFVATGVALNGKLGLSASLAGYLQDSQAEAALAPRQRWAISDLALRVRHASVQRDRWAVGPALGLQLPTGTAQSWVAESGPRFEPALLGELSLGPFRLVGDLGLVLRTQRSQGVDLDLGHQVAVGLGAAVQVHERLDLLAELNSRHGLDSFLRAGGENPAIAVVGGRGCLPSVLCADLGFGTALSHGYGASSLRVLLALRRLPASPASPELQMVELPVSDPSAVVVPPPAPPPVLGWAPGLLAQVWRGRILVKEPILFEQGTAVIRPVSRPTLEAVGEVMRQYPQIEQLVVEGHASEEGEVAANFELSLARARAVFEALVEVSVRPERLSYRGMGELYPSQDPELAGDRPAQRRVELLIASLGPMSDGRMGPLVLPWSGEERPAPVPGTARLGSDAHPLLEESSEAPEADGAVEPAYFLEDSELRSSKGAAEDEEPEP